MKQKKCSRCGSTKNIESHHIVFKSEGGSDKKSNRKDLCNGCHDYIHAEAAVQKKIAYYEKMLKLLQYRLQILNEFNTPENILQFGYRSYWIDEKTHGDNPGRKKYRRRKNGNNISRGR